MGTTRQRWPAGRLGSPCPTCTSQAGNVERHSASPQLMHTRVSCSIRSTLSSLQRRYNPTEMTCWEAGQPLPYLHIALGLAAMHSTEA